MTSASWSSTAPLAASEEDPTPATPSLLGALVIVARHRGLDLNPTELINNHRLGPGEPAPEELLHIARGCGLRAMSITLGWGDLLCMTAALPAILVLENGRAVVLLRAAADAQPPHVVVQDPNAGNDALLTLDEARLTGGWSGRVILVKRDYRIRRPGPAFRDRLYRGAAAARSPHSARHRNLGDGAEPSGAEPDHVLAPADRQGSLLPQPQYAGGAFRRHAGADYL